VNVRFTAHARQQMQRRRVSEERVRATLRDPDITQPGDDGARTFVKRFDEGVLKVWAYRPIDVENDEIVVKSTAWRECDDD